MRTSESKAQERGGAEKCLTRQDTKRNGGMPGHVEPKKVGVTRHKGWGAADGL